MEGLTLTWNMLKTFIDFGMFRSSVVNIFVFYWVWLFRYEFSSWREFSYLDEENTEKAEKLDGTFQEQ